MDVAPIAAAAAVVGITGLIWHRQVCAKSVEDIPARMRRIVLLEANKDIAQARLEMEETDVPKPRHNEVLIKLAAAPVNPSDEGKWKAKPSRGYPSACGNEGSGRVVASGGGFFAGRLVGRSVAFVCDGGSFGEYVTVNALTSVFEMPEDVPVENACSFVINPFTVVGMAESAKACGGGAFIQTAAASQLGQMLVKYCQLEGMEVVNLVRKEEQAKILRDLGAVHIINSGEEGWEAELSRKIAELRINCAFDAVSGNLSGTLLSMLPPKGTVFVYGRLAPERCGNIDPLDLIYRQKKIKGWFLTAWMTEGGMLRSLIRSVRTANLVRKHLATAFASAFQDIDMESMHREYCKLRETGLTGTKLRVRVSEAKNM